MRMDNKVVVELSLPSELGYEKLARETVATIAHHFNFCQEKIENIRTAISEACTNAIRYGSGSDTRMRVEVIFAADENKLEILIKDPGASGVPAVAIAPPDIRGMVEGKHRLGGMGLYIIQMLVDEAGFVEASDEAEGTQFRMVIYKVGSHKLRLAPF